MQKSLHYIYLKSLQPKRGKKPLLYVELNSNFAEIVPSDILKAELTLIFHFLNNLSQNLFQESSSWELRISIK